MMEKYVAPIFRANAFHCPHCGVYAHQIWTVGHLMDVGRASNHESGRFIVDNLVVSRCARCKSDAFWLDEKMLHPVSSDAPAPVEDMPPDVREDFIEAQRIVNASPRSACALLRLSIQKLMPHLGEKGKNIDYDISSLVRKGLPEKIQKALDTVRVIGNNAVHPGELDLKDDVETAITLFGLVNMVVDVMITQPRKVDALYSNLPQGALEHIKQRDGATR